MRRPVETKVKKPDKKQKHLNKTIRSAVCTRATCGKISSGLMRTKLNVFHCKTRQWWYHAAGEPVLQQEQA